MARPDPATIDIRMRSSQSAEPEPELKPKPEEEPVTPYTERRQAGHYDAPDQPEPEASEQAEAAEQESDEDLGSLAELRAEAEALGLATYGTKAQIAERIAQAENTSSEK